MTKIVKCLSRKKLTVHTLTLGCTNHTLRYSRFTR